MAVFSASEGRTTIQVPTWKEFRTMLASHPAVAVALVIGATLIGLALIWVLYRLVHEGHDTSALLSLAGLIIGALGYRAAADARGKVDELKSRMES